MMNTNLLIIISIIIFFTLYIALNLIVYYVYFYLHKIKFYLYYPINFLKKLFEKEDSKLIKITTMLKNLRYCIDSIHEFLNNHKILCSGDMTKMFFSNTFDYYDKILYDYIFLMENYISINNENINDFVVRRYYNIIDNSIDKMIEKFYGWANGQNDYYIKDNEGNYILEKDGSRKINEYYSKISFYGKYLWKIPENKIF